MVAVNWGIIGPGGIAKLFADGLAESEAGKLLSVASSNPERLKAFGERHHIAPERRYTSYDALCADPDVHAIHIATPHPWHAEHAILAMRHGKHVLCEKPAGMSAAEVVAMTEIARQQNVFFMEAFMYRCHPQVARMIEIIRSGEIGEIRHISASFGFAAPFDANSRLYDVAKGGGAILDVGCYPMSMARLVAGAAIGKDFDNPVVVRGSARLAATGVDEESYAILRFPGGMTADIAASISVEMQNAVHIRGSKGKLTLPSPWTPGREGGPSDAVIEVRVGNVMRKEMIASPHHLFYFEADMASRAIAAGQTEADSPAIGHAESVGNAEALDRWLAECGYRTSAMVPSLGRKLKQVIPKSLPRIPRVPLPGVDIPVSRLVIGCDNRNTFAEGAIVWDAWMEAGGNAFDTGFVYGGGRHEEVLGEWIAARGLAKETNVIVKGAHTPYCTPHAIKAQLDISLDRLKLDRAPIYIMHRDNLDIPVGEFMTALNDLHRAGRIGVFGGSNWSVERFAEANAYAAAHGLKPMSILNNNLSLAVMEKPVWAGCVTSNTPSMLAHLRRNSIAHFSWSSQARGYFLPAELRNRLPQAEGPDACFGSPANEERRRRAAVIAEKRGVSPHNIAAAWVLAQAFPSFALVGPRSPGEIASLLPALTVQLTPEEVTWLNLEEKGSGPAALA